MKSVSKSVLRSVLCLFPRFQRSCSMDESCREFTLADELDFDVATLLQRSVSSQLIDIPSISENPRCIVDVASKYSWNEQMRDDISNLLAKVGDDDMVDDAGMPILLQVGECFTKFSASS